MAWHQPPTSFVTLMKKIMRSFMDGKTQYAMSEIEDKV